MADEPFRTQVPNIIDDMGLDPFERALYVHYRRVCGNNPGSYCYETVKTTAQKLKMSDGQVSESRKTLAQRGLILVQAGRPVIVTIVDIWNLNEAYYRLEHRPDIDGWTVEALGNWLSDIHTVNVHSHNNSNLSTRSECNLTEDDKPATNIHTVNEHSPSETNPTINNDMSSNIHIVKQRSKESLIIDSTSRQESKRGGVESRPPTCKILPGPVSQALLEICQLDWDFVDKEPSIQTPFKQRIDFLAKKGAQPGDVREFETWRRLYHWSGKKDDSPPTLKQVGEFWGQYQEWVKAGKPAQQNGAKQNGSNQRSIRPLQRTGEALERERTIDIYTDEYVYPDGHREPIPAVS